MKRLLLAALLAMTVSPALAAEDSVLLHCAGGTIPADGVTFHKNFLLAKDGSWIKWGPKRWARDLNYNDHFRYAFSVSIMSDTMDVEIKLLADDLSLSLHRTFQETGRRMDSQHLSCFPTTSPFTLEW
jgi:hypothetical protein